MTGFQPHRRCPTAASTHLGFVLGLLLSLLVTSAVTQFQFPGLGANSPYSANQYSAHVPGPFQHQQYSAFQPQQRSLPAPQPQNTLFQQPQYTYQNQNGGHQSQPAISQHSVPSSAVPAQSLTEEPVHGGFSIANGSYILEWEVNDPVITFRARRRGVGFVGFAISPSGGMSGADIFIAGVGPTGMPFANDYHHEYLPGGVGSAVPDVTNDYQVLDISEANGYTSVKFQRLLDTRDIGEDHAIENREQNVLWSIGPPSRMLEYHGPTNRGVVKINLVNPPPKFRLQRPLS